MTNDSYLGVGASQPAPTMQAASETVLGGVTFATPEEVRNLVANKVLSPAGVGELFKGANVSFTDNGYQKLPSGIIIQWGKVDTTFTWTTGNKVSVLFPIQFPNGCLTLSVTSKLADVVGGVVTVHVKDFTNTGADFMSDNSSYVNTPGTLMYFAIGH